VPAADCHEPRPVSVGGRRSASLNEHPTVITITCGCTVTLASAFNIPASPASDASEVSQVHAQYLQR